MSERPYRDDYEKLFLQLCHKVERFLLKSITAALLLLILTQVLLQIAPLRQLLSLVDSLEGVPYQLPQGRAAGGGFIVEEQRKHK